MSAGGEPMNSLNVLLVTYVFPPVGGVGVLRAASLARYFPAEGIRLDVITARNASAVGADPTLLNEIPAEVTVHRTVTLDLPFGIKKAIKRLITRSNQTVVNASTAAVTSKSGLLKRALEEMLLPDPQVTWLPVLARAARRIVRERNIGLVLITAPPFSTVLLVEKLRKQFPLLPIVVDFRDEWLSSTIRLVSFSSSKRAFTIARRAEASCVKNATAVVAVTEGARREIHGRYPHEPESKFHHIPNGFDATRLQISTRSPGPRPDGKIIVTYVGTVYASSEPTTLVQALQSLPSEIKCRFELRFIGHIEEPRFREALLQLGDMVGLKGYMPQHEALNLMNETDYVLLISHDHLNISAKFYDYIGAGKPMLACVHPDGDNRILLEELHAGWWADSRDVEGIRRLFIDAAARSNSLLTEFRPDAEKIAQYERKILAQRYAGLLHSIARRQNNVGSESCNPEAAELVKQP
jgi:glycosyltransferase involved in cell wall biosynthesis